MEKKIIEGKFTNALIFLGLGIACILGGFLYGVTMQDPSADVPSLSGIVLGIILVILFFITKNCEISVTDKRIYGKAIFGKRVDLPLDSVTAIGSSVFAGIAVSTASGSLHFCLLRNRDELHKAVSNLLIERQGKGSPQQMVMPQSSAEELKKYKELLDSGIISQEEFDAKKKQLLGL